VQRLRPELWRQKNWLLHDDNTAPRISFLTREILTRNYMTFVPHPRYFSPFPRLKYRHFDPIEVIEAESQALLNTLTEHHFQDALKCQKRWERCISEEGDYFEGDGGQ
jgi:hypothetical protein